MNVSTAQRAVLIALVTLVTAQVAAASTNAAPVAPAVPDVTFSLLRIFGALLVVLAVFFGGVWMLRNWQRVAGAAGRRPMKLHVLEMRSLGARHAVFVVGYEQHRLLVASSPTGVTLLDRLPDAAPGETVPTPAAVPFAEALSRLIPHR